ncbi:Protein of unknown function DUF1659 [Syntrophomonas zehnderi OL-4]|uniref:DUF1659 domain-containing protein n=1 Tax=Syntrophomonas zehnderi OL-4 TaxID=690567 RepID=A0A0E4GB84_9FIRM|nr:DUF1659 domain-containing protein [Syntrophomonas zehnderi]CFX78397.1 Protein of unknown function DUF1659 [Syntrophomonas zehnderi OL-4]
MAVTSNSLASDLVLIMEDGIGASGQPRSKSRVFKGIKTDANNADVYDVAQTLIGLQSRLNQAIQRRDTVELTNV